MGDGHQNNYVGLLGDCREIEMGFREQLDSISMGDIQRYKRIKATVLSVIMRDSDSCTVGLTVGDEYTNLTLRFDRGSSAELCGYPMNWGVHNVNVDYYDSSSPTYAELVEADGELEDGQVYISAEDEEWILKCLLQSIKKQFKKGEWLKECPTRSQSKFIRKLETAIKKAAV